MGSHSFRSSTGTDNQTLADGTYNYAHDDEGDRTSRTEIATGAVTVYTWDHRNRLTPLPRSIVNRSGGRDVVARS